MKNVISNKKLRTWIEVAKLLGITYNASLYHVTQNYIPFGPRTMRGKLRYFTDEDVKVAAEYFGVDLPTKM